jgi:hypothetical protein
MEFEGFEERKAADVVAWYWAGRREIERERGGGGEVCGVTQGEREGERGRKTEKQGENREQRHREENNSLSAPSSAPSTPPGRGSFRVHGEYVAANNSIALVIDHAIHHTTAPHASPNTCPSSLLFLVEISEQMEGLLHSKQEAGLMVQSGGPRVGTFYLIGPSDSRGKRVCVSEIRRPPDFASINDQTVFVFLLP